MKHGSTLFLKVVLYLFALAVLALCVIIAGVSLSGNAGIYLPILVVMATAAIPFFIGLYQGLLLLRYIDKNTAFSNLSVKALQNIKYCASTISVLYAASMPLIIYVADVDDAPGVVLMGLVFTFAPLVTSVFAAVLERLLRSALDIKSENDRMERYLKIVGITLIIAVCYLGIRYMGVVIHYTCAIPQEDCPPPINGLGQLGYYLTGGPLVPLWK